MITVYDLESFSPIDVDDAATPQAMPEYAPLPEPRLQTVAGSTGAELTAGRDFSAVIAAHSLANLALPD